MSKSDYYVGGVLPSCGCGLDGGKKRFDCLQVEVQGLEPFNRPPGHYGFNCSGQVRPQLPPAIDMEQAKLQAASSDVALAVGVAMGALEPWLDHGADEDAPQMACDALADAFRKAGLFTAKAAPAIDLEQIRVLAQGAMDTLTQNKTFPADVATAVGHMRRLLALIDGQAGGQSHPDTDRLDFIEGECLAVEAVSVRASEDDADVAWVISQHHMGRGQVVLHRSHDDNLRRAIDAVMQPAKGEGVATACDTCSDHGQVGGLLPSGGGYDSQPCPDCHPHLPCDNCHGRPTKGEGEQ